MIKIERILCPTDLSPESDEGLRYGLALANAYQARLILYSCIHAGASGSGGFQTPHIAARKNAQALFERSLRRYLDASSLASLDWEGIIVECDEVGDAIAHQAAVYRVDLIVMRSRRRPHRAALLGSTAESVCRTAPCPVLVTHTDERDWVGGQTRQIELKRLLVAYDFSDYSELALRYALSFGQEYQSELQLLHVLPPHTVDEPEISWYPRGNEGAYHKARARLQKAVPGEAHLWCNINYEVTEGRPYREILSHAETHGIDLICIGAHGVGFGTRALFGSNVDRVLRQAPCPVLVARPLKPVHTLGAELARQHGVVEAMRHANSLEVKL
jgi:nucleotide-binding universal stress UspA family protein